MKTHSSWEKEMSKPLLSGGSDDAASLWSFDTITSLTHIENAKNQGV
jgi:hypothetical protein